VVEAEPTRLAQALDNLIANALEHGGPPFALTASRVAGRVRISLSDGGGGQGAEGDRDRSPRRGHGLAVVRAVARAHGGRFALHRATSGAVAALELPLARAGALAA
jgi:signal transduction histidine kinase